MPSEYDQQLLESVAVRRSRMVGALVFGENRTRRNHADGVRRTIVGVVLAALIAAGCVGYSFAVRAMALAKEQARTPGISSTATPSLAPTGSPAPTWSSSGYLSSPSGWSGVQTVARDVR